MRTESRCLRSATILLGLALATEAAAAETPLTLGAPVSGTISAPGEIDWYVVTTDVVGDLKVTQTAWPPYIETRIAIFGPGSQLLEQGNPTPAAAPGTYYIKVWSANNGSSGDVYTFTATLATAGTGNDVDTGKNNATGAVAIVLGRPVSDTIAPSKETATKQDVDWFAVTTDVVGDLTVTQTAWPPYIETRIAIFGPNNDTLAQGNPVRAAAPGTYHIKVWSATDGSSIAPYTFSATLEPAKTGNDIDSSANSVAGAVPLTLGTPVSDTIAPSKETAGKQDVDWFKVTTAVVGDLKVTQTEWPPYIETRIDIFGPNSGTQAQSNPVKAAAPGTYYFKVSSTTEGSSIAPYTFTVSQAGVATPDGGVDAGKPDAGTADGASDGVRVDSGSLDARAPDGSTSNDGSASKDGSTSRDGSASRNGSTSRDGSSWAGTSKDSGLPGENTSSDESGGCSCATVVPSSGRGGRGSSLLGLALALAVVWRRSRRSGSSRAVP